ncbi:MAG TPA: lipocalin-like domain-containing protein, partial [Chitinophagaceae bacterium]|nr:lipocalin-like domain-containing protein [Chitinophagaceae bacterium]
KAQLAGMYKLYIAENADSNGVWHEDPWTKGGTGYIVYDGLGHMAVHITRKGYNDYNWLPEEQSLRDEYINQKLDSMSTDELKDAVRAFASSYVYAGNYNIEDTADIVQHHRISTSIHSPVGSTVRRAYSFSGDTIILHVLNGNRRLKWIKQP